MPRAGEYRPCSIRAGRPDAGGPGPVRYALSVSTRWLLRRCRACCGPGADPAVRRRTGGAAGVRADGFFHSSVWAGRGVFRWLLA